MQKNVTERLANSSVNFHGNLRGFLGTAKGEAVGTVTSQVVKPTIIVAHTKSRLVATGICAKLWLLLRVREEMNW